MPPTCCYDDTKIDRYLILKIELSVHTTTKSLKGISSGGSITSKILVLVVVVTLVVLVRIHSIHIQQVTRVNTCELHHPHTTSTHTHKTRFMMNSYHRTEEKSLSSFFYYYIRHLQFQCHFVLHNKKKMKRHYYAAQPY